MSWEVELRMKSILTCFVALSILIILTSCGSGKKGIRIEEVDPDGEFHLDNRNYNYDSLFHTDALPYALKILDDKRSGIWSVEFFDLDGDSTIFSYDNNNNLLPASNLKLITTAAALKVLGKDYQFKTEFYYTGEIDTNSKTLNGNIVIWGTGDPTIGADYFRDSSLVKFRKLVKQIKYNFDVDTICGDIVIQNDLSYDRWYGKGWDIDDIPYYYAPIISQLSFNENLVKIIIDKNKIETIPHYPFKFKLDTVDIKREKIYRVMGTDSVIVKARFDKEIRNYVTVQDPFKLFKLQFKKALSRGGVVLKKADNAKLKLRNEKHIGNIYSDSLAALVLKCNRESNNFYAEQLFRETARIYALDSLEEKSLFDRKELSYDEIMSQNQKLYSSLFAIDDASPKDGSGLSRMNFFSAGMITKTLRIMFKESLFPVYLASCAQPGYDGSLRRKFLSEDINGKLFAKSGSMTGVNNISGYLITDSGRRVAFSILNNYYNYYRGTMNRRLEEIISYFIVNY